MGEITALTRTLNLLASIRHEDDPTIGELLAAVPDLQKMDWINRFGPARAWESVASDIQTDALEWLTKALVIAEREFDSIGGSVAAPIWLYQAYSTRVGADADALANWVLKNRGSNEYVPFGRRASARSAEEWRAEEKRRQLHREAMREIEEQQKKKRLSASNEQLKESLNEEVKAENDTSVSKDNWCNYAPSRVASACLSSPETLATAGEDPTLIDCRVH